MTSLSLIMISMRIRTIILCLSFIAIAHANYATTSALRTNLLQNYNPQVRPVKDHSHNTTVQLAISINSLNLDDVSQKLSVVCWVFITWPDELLVWDPDAYDDIQSVNMDKEEIWTPDIALFNSANGASVFPNTKLPVLTSHTGTLVLGAPFTAVVPCSIDLYKWPTDEHNCSLKFGSWAHHGEQINLELGTWFNKTIMLEVYEESSKWSLLNETATKRTSSMGDQIYFHIDFNLTVKRNGSGHAVYLSHGTAAVMIIILGAYLLPLNYHLSRIVLHLFALGILIACDLVLFANLPTTEGKVPHIVRYYAGSIVLTTMSLICNILMTLSLSGPFGPNNGLRAKLAEMWSKSAATSTLEPSGEIAYRTLENDLTSEIPNNAAMTIQMESSSQNSIGVRMKKPESYLVQSFYGSTAIHRVVNAVLFSLFFFAYAIDYIVLYGTIYY